MREIKFRAWNGKKMMTDCFLIRPWDGELIQDEGTSMLDWKLMQFTGLRDKNGKEIYEGDVVQFDVNGFNPMIDTNRARVIYAEGGFVFDAHRYDYMGKPDYIHFGFWVNPGKAGLEVIGNIYEKPELLTPPAEA